MATSGQISGNYWDSKELGGLAFSVVLKWEKVSQSILNNTSTIKYTLTCRSSLNRFSTNASWNIAINGNNLNGQYSGIVNTSEKIVTSGNITIPHTSTNSQTFNFSFVFNHTAIARASASGTGELDSIPQQATIRRSIYFFDEENPILYYSTENSKGLTSLQACFSFDGIEDAFAYQDVPNNGIYDESCELTLSEDDRNILRANITSGYSGNVKCYLVSTFDNEKSYHYRTFSYQLTDYTPVITPTIYDTNPDTIALTGNSSHLIQYMSNVHYKMNVELRKGALDVIGCYIQNDGKIEEGLLEGDFGAPTTNTFYFSATDNRGNTGTASKSYDMFWGEYIKYIKLTCSAKSSSITAQGNATVTLEGKYFNAYFGVAQNSLELSYAAYKAGEAPSFSAYQTISPTMTDNTTYSYSFNISGLDHTSQYTIAVRVKDKLITSEVTTTALSNAVFEWDRNSFAFNVPVTFNQSFVQPSSDFKVLWEGYSNLESTSTVVNLSEAVSDQHNGIVLVFMVYDGENYANWADCISSHFVSKKIVEIAPGFLHSYLLVSDPTVSMVGVKGAYIYDEYISGISSNTKSGTTCDIAHNNNRFVLRYVLGV